MRDCLRQCICGAISYSGCICGVRGVHKILLPSKCGYNDYFGVPDSIYGRKNQKDVGGLCGGQRG